MAAHTMLKCTATDAVTLRRQAGDLLDRLVADRDIIDRRLTEAGRRDPIRVITGRSALEEAIASTRDMIDRMDLLLQDLNGQVEASSGESIASPKHDDNRPLITLPFPRTGHHRSRVTLPGRQRTVAVTA